jgi:hypothetical protein
LLAAQPREGERERHFVILRGAGLEQVLLCSGELAAARQRHAQGVVRSAQLRLQLHCQARLVYGGIEPLLIVQAQREQGVRRCVIGLLREQLPQQLNGAVELLHAYGAPRVIEQRLAHCSTTRSQAGASASSSRPSAAATNSTPIPLRFCPPKYS